MRTGRARGGGGGVRALSAGADRNKARRQVNDGRGNKERRDAARPLREQNLVLALDDLETPDTAADEHAHLFGVFRSDLQAGTTQSAIRGRDGELDETRHLL